MALLTADELYYFNEGTTSRAYESLGCHRVDYEGQPAFRFAVWAPNAKRVAVCGDWNGWSQDADVMTPVGATGVWEIFIGIAHDKNLYKYAITAQDGTVVLKADPYAFACEYEGTASMIWASDPFPWTDEAFLHGGCNLHNRPMNIYEVHLGSWKRGLSYRDLAHELVDYAADMGYSHLELMPLMCYPYEPSWGYQVTGYFAPTSRYGTPDDLKYLINRAHEKGIGVIMDWVPAHFTRDAHGLARFDGTPLYENPDTRKSDMKQWGTLLFDYGRSQVQSFLVSNAVYWLSEFHFDGLRADAVSAMLYLDYGREHGEWVANEFGGKENLDAVALFQKIAKAIAELPGHKLLIAEESTAFPKVTNKHEDSLGFDYKWNMGWMHDMLSYMQMDSFFRKWNHDKLTFSLLYAFSEYYILPFSHDEVVHGKLSMLGKMSGDYWQKFAQLRLLYAYQIAHPGKKLTFMGMELGQFIEWRFDESLDWLLLDYPKHEELQQCMKDLNHFYQKTPALFACDDDWFGFEWVTVNDSAHSVCSFLRRDRHGNALLAVFNFTPVPWDNYHMGVPGEGRYTEVFSTDMPGFGGTGQYENGILRTKALPMDRFPHRLEMKLAPYGAAYYEYREKEVKHKK
ncbi:MAG: 1,4-alpha-glucan branching protein GlgB [Clostridiales bacterium]|nr:1,4-alpha-glucan branching protein GlgB [Clostridiales bacterium]